jgi:hypothetical protein
VCSTKVLQKNSTKLQIAHRGGFLLRQFLHFKFSQKSIDKGLYKVLVLTGQQPHFLELLEQFLIG